MTTECVQIFKALADETRFALLNLLLTRDLCVGALARHLKISEAAVSQHLKLLREAGLVRGEKRGYWTHYTVVKEQVHALAEGLKVLTNLPISSEGSCARNLDQQKDCQKEDEKMCDCKCQKPEKLKGKPEECTPEQIRECHGDQEHPCSDNKKPKNE
ncbi:MAG: helix-turn-helix transcriptional regulator [Deltaproteobacteria bacterium]|nr:helix-turn-helix transcriptional regulator [Deltaproteobacteria bacterium]